MNSVKFQDTKLIYRNLLNFYTQTEIKGVPAVAQWVKNPPAATQVTVEVWVQFLTSTLG